MSWLSYLNKNCGAESLLGVDLSNVAQQAWVYNCANDMGNFYGEAPLLGPAAMDLSCQYMFSLFAKGNAFKDHEFEEQGEKFTYVSRLLMKRCPDFAKEGCMFLEADTSKGPQDKLSVFYNIVEPYFQELLPQVFQQEAYSGMEAKVLEVCRRLHPYADIWQLGLMQGREHRPVRLCMHIQKGSFYECMRLLGKAEQIEVIKKQLQPILDLNIFTEDLMDIDVYPDGSVGPVLGFELCVKKPYPIAQKTLYSTEKYARFKELLVANGMADERINVVEQCVVSMVALDKGQPPYHMYSGLSHYKLLWNDGVAMPSKVYLRFRPVELQRNVNESLGVVKNKN